MKLTAINLMRGKMKISEGEIISQERVIHRLLFNTNKNDCTKSEYAKVKWYRCMWKKGELTPNIQNQLLVESGLEIHTPAFWKLKLKANG